jgi:antitoxin component YwqK of YwqJK toxin-antitoxin module
MKTVKQTTLCVLVAVTASCHSKSPVTRIVIDVPVLECGTHQLRSKAGGLEQWCVDASDQNNGPSVVYFPNRTRLSEGAYQNGVRSGMWQEWHSNGQLKMRGSYTKGQRASAWQWWDLGGRIYQEGAYIDGQQYGRWVVYFETGRVQSEGEYQAGEQHGFWNQWHENGRKSAEGSYELGMKKPGWKYWDVNGVERAP